MGIFGNKKRDLPPLWGAHDEMEIVPAQPHYETVMDWLVGLSDEEYKKVIKCADISRKSQADQCKVLGIENEPTTFINDPKDQLQTMPPAEISGSFLDDDDTELGNFLEDDEPTPVKVKINKTEKPKK